MRLPVIKRGRDIYRILHNRQYFLQISHSAFLKAPVSKFKKFVTLVIAEL